MSICACGRNTNAGLSACDRCAALATFGLTPGATKDEIKDAYRTLAKVWHPDRFPGDEHLRQKAEDKLKEINSAYQILSTPAEEIPRRQSARTASQSDAPSPTTTEDSGEEPYQDASTGNFRASFRTKRRRNMTQLSVAIILVAVAIWAALQHGRFLLSEFGTATATVGSVGRQMASAVTDKIQTETVGRDTATGQESKQKMQSPKQGTIDSANPANKTAANPRTKATASDRASLLVFPPEDPGVPYFTVGSTKDDVIRVQGVPTRITGSVFAYGHSEVYFKDGRVQSWQMDPSSPLKAQMP